MEMKKNLGYFKDRFENFYKNQLSKYKYDFNKLIQINEYIIIEKIVNSFFYNDIFIDFNKLIQINEYIIIEKRVNNFAKYLITI